MGWMLAEYVCESNRCDAGRFEELQERPAPRQHPCPGCGAPADRIISAPKPKVSSFEVQKGKKQEKPHPFAQDTEALADGMPAHLWRKQRKEMWADARRRRARKLVG